MNKLIRKILCILLLSIGIISILATLSTIPALSSVMNMLTNSGNYQDMGSEETLTLFNKSQSPNTTHKLILGDSVANQIYEYRDNEEYSVLTGNYAMTFVWQYLFAKNYLETNPQTTDIYLCTTADGFEQSFDTTLSYSYVVIPLAKSNNLEVLDEKHHKLLTNIFGSVFINEKVASFIGNSGLNSKLYLNAIKNFYETFPTKKEKVEKTDNPDFLLAETYIMKIYELCKEKNVNFHLLPNPKKDTSEIREYVKQLETKYLQSPLYSINPNYFDQIVFYPEDLFKDELHFKDEYLEKENKFEIIRKIQNSTGELQDLIE